jgi:hypothetical protein
MNADHEQQKSLEWLKHSNDELAELVKKRGRSVRRWRLLALLLLLITGWVVYRYGLVRPIEDLWQWPG